MISLTNDQLNIHFPEVHPLANCSISFQRTLRIPDDGKEYPLPPGLGNFPMHHIEDHRSRLPDTWAEHGGVFLPMYQSEALWIDFNCSYPMAIQIAAGKINAVTGKEWEEQLMFSPQNYLVASEQPWLDGFCVEEGTIRQFVAAPLGEGVTVEEQLTGEDQWGGLQIQAWPLKRATWERMQKSSHVEDMACVRSDVVFSMMPSLGLGMGGRMKQDIYDDTYEPSDWDQDYSSRCFVHLLNSTQYAAVTGKLPPHKPFTSQEYTSAGFPWFDYYKEAKALPGSKLLRGLKSIMEFHNKEETENIVVAPTQVTQLRKGSRVTTGNEFG
jgi:hypothetical protein